jgi:hypothetical protein
VHDHLLAVERRVEVRDDAYAPVAVLGQHEGLRRGHVLVAGAERTRLELFGRRRVERRTRCARTLCAPWSDHGDAARLRFAAKLAAQVEPSDWAPRKGRIRSIGAGKTIVVDGDPPRS